MKLSAAEIRQLRKYNLTFSSALTRIPISHWSTQALIAVGNDAPIDVFRSRTFLVQVFHQDGKYLRLTVSRTEYDERTQRYKEGISWDELQSIKAELGFSDRCALEVFPPDDLVVSVQNMRHLFILPKGQVPGFVWKENYDRGSIDSDGRCDQRTES